MTETPIQDAAQKSPAARSPRSHYVGALGRPACPGDPCSPGLPRKPELASWRLLWRDGLLRAHRLPHHALHRARDWSRGAPRLPSLCPEARDKAFALHACRRGREHAAVRVPRPQPASQGEVRRRPRAPLCGERFLHSEKSLLLCQRGTPLSPHPLLVPRRRHAVLCDLAARPAGDAQGREVPPRGLLGRGRPFRCLRGPHGRSLRPRRRHRPHLLRA